MCVDVDNSAPDNHVIMKLLKRGEASTAEEMILFFKGDAKCVRW